MLNNERLNHIQTEQQVIEKDEDKEKKTAKNERVQTFSKLWLIPYISSS